MGPDTVAHSFMGRWSDVQDERGTVYLDSDDQDLEQGRQDLHRQAVKLRAHSLRQYTNELACLAGHCRPPATHFSLQMPR